MSKRKQQSCIEAAEWWTALRDGELSRADGQRFVDWLQASPENVAEYLAMADLWQELAAIGSDADVQAILAHAGDNIVSLASPVQAAPPAIRPFGEIQGWLAAAACALILTVGGLILLQQRDEPVSTAVGEQRSITLTDGSVITLNTRTTIRHAFDESTRRLELIDGEALFDVSHDEQRPFIVTAGSTEVRVLGTSFNIYKKSNLEATITVLEGRVSVRAPGLGEQAAAVSGEAPSGEQAEVELTDGQQIHIQPKEPAVPVKQVPPDRATEWTTRRITFENTALRDVVAQFNRYNIRQLRVDDPELAMLQLNGVFEPHSQEDLLEYLRQAEGVQVHGKGNDRVITR